VFREEHRRLSFIALFATSWTDSERLREFVALPAGIPKIFRNKAAGPKIYRSGGGFVGPPGMFVG
jgi:hypothetical protein